MKQITEHTAIPGAERLTPELAEKYVVYLCFDDQKCSFCGYDPEDPSTFFYQEIAFSKGKTVADSFKEVYFRNEYFTYSFKKVTVMLTSRYYSIIPSEAFDPAKKKNILSFAFSDPIEKALQQSLPKIHSELVFNISDELYEFCSRSFLNPEFKHHIAPVMNQLLERSKTVYHKHLSVFIRGSEIDILCVDKGELTFANSFPYSHTNDNIYFILAAWKQLELNQLDDRLYLFGVADEVDALKKALANYLQHIDSLEPAEQAANFGPAIQQIPFEITSLLLCES